MITSYAGAAHNAYQPPRVFLSWPVSNVIAWNDRYVRKRREAASGWWVAWRGNRFCLHGRLSRRLFAREHRRARRSHQEASKTVCIKMPVKKRPALKLLIKLDAPMRNKNALPRHARNRARCGREVMCVMRVLSCCVYSFHNWSAH